MSSDLSRELVKATGAEDAQDRAAGYAVDQHTKTDAVVPALLAISFGIERIGVALERIADSLDSAGAELDRGA
jgi:hypothetical protein